MSPLLNQPSGVNAAFVAGMGVGALRDWSEIARYAAPGRSFAPDPARHAEYERKYRLWRELYERLKTLYPKLPAET